MSARGQVSSLPSEEFRWQRSVSAGPYSTVNTASGTLITTIPLARLSGPGGSQLDFAITHTSGNNISNTPGQVAKRWRHTYDEWVVPKGLGSTELQRNSPGGALAEWYKPVVPGPYASRPGNRDDVVQEPDATYTVTHKDQTKGYYRFNRGGSYCLTSLADTHGNAISVNYDPQTFRPQQIVDATGVRNIALTWAGTYALGSATLNVPGDSRTWDFTIDGNLHITQITFPAPVAGAIRPTIRMTYNTLGNITDLYDLNGNHWHYEYQTQLGTPRVTKVHEPYIPNPSQYSSAFVLLNYQSNIDGQFTQTCTITDQLSRVTKHVYDTNGNQWVNLLIKKVVDPKVSEDASAFFAQYVWNYSSGTLATLTDRRNFVWQFTWDTGNKGNLLVERDPRAGETKYLYSAQNRLLRKIDAVGNREL